MNDEQANLSNLVDTTDCLEAVGVFRSWKNFLFLIVILCLLLLQASFWLTDIGYVKTNDTSQEVEDVTKPQQVPVQPAAEVDQIKEAAKQATAEPNKPAEAAPQQPKQTESRFIIKFKHLSWLIRLLNSVLIPAAVLYCLTMLFSLKVSLLGRLGGINHISRAFFLSLIVLVLLLPWQMVFAPVTIGAMYTSEELLRWVTTSTENGLVKVFLYYLRFAGYWLLVVLLLIFAQIRSARWTKATLKRLEVI